MQKSAIVEVVFLGPLFDKIPQAQEEHGVPRTNIMKYRL